MGPLERFIGAVTAAIAAATGPAEQPTPAAAVDAPAEIAAPVVPQSVPLPRPRPTPDAPIEVAVANPFVAPGEQVPAATTPDAVAAIGAATNPFVAPPAGVEPPPALGPVGDAAAVAMTLPGVTMLVVHPQAGAGAPIDPVPLDLPAALAALGQGPSPVIPAADAPLGFAATNLPLDGPAGAIDELLRGGLEGPAAGALIADTAPMPLPRANPLPEAERVRVAALPGTNVFEPPPAPARDNACVSQLASLALIATVLPPVQDGACGIATPIDLAQLGRGRNTVTLTPDATVDCHMAGALNAWMDESVQAAATRLFGQNVTSLRVASSYACRGVNNDPTAPLSEHAFGRAIDISAFQFADGTWLNVHAAAEGTPEAQFLTEIRTDACGPFTTVLGPGVANHADHFHFDLAVRGRNGDALYCR